MTVCVSSGQRESRYNVGTDAVYNSQPGEVVEAFPVLLQSGWSLYTPSLATPGLCLCLRGAVPEYVRSRLPPSSSSSSPLSTLWSFSWGKHVHSTEAAA